MTNYQPTAEEREWIEHELERDPRLREEWLVAHLKARAADAADQERIRKLAAAAGTSPQAIRQAEAERRTAEATARRAAELARARGAVSPGPRPGPENLTDADAVLVAKGLLRAAGKPAGERSIAKELGVNRSTVRRALGKGG